VNTASTVMIYVQHLLGVGHLVRAAALARAFAAAGWASHLVSGGRPWPNLDCAAARLHQLPPLTAADADFSHLVTETGAAADDAFLADRAARLQAVFHELSPDVLIVEHYPFGRRQMRFELAPLLTAARGASLAVCSLRDILVDRRTERHAEARDIVQENFDLVLVHGDPEFIRLDATFPFAGAIEDRMAYTGFLDAGPQAPISTATQGNGEIIISAGGGAVGQRLEVVALAAAGLEADKRWRLLIGVNRPDDAVRQLNDSAPANLTVERARPDFRNLLANAAVSVSQAGYNTVMDILSARPPAVLIPFATGRETEQTLRAERLEALGLAVHLPERELDAASLAAAVVRARDLGRPDHSLNLDGAEQSVTLVANRLAARQAAAP
jgi:predicted glycosyltransferase